MKNGIIQKLSCNMFVISTTVLSGYVLSGNPLVTKQSMILAGVCAVSGFSLVKKNGVSREK